MDLFSNLDDYINEPSTPPSLNVSLPTNETSIDISGEDSSFKIDSPDLSPRKSFVPGRGQKTAYKKIQAIKKRMEASFERLNASLVGENKNSTPNKIDNTSAKNSRKKIGKITSPALARPTQSSRSRRPTRASWSLQSSRSSSRSSRSSRSSISRQYINNEIANIQASNNIIIMDSDDEQQFPPLLSTSSSSKNSSLLDFETENYEMSVKVKWKTKIHLIKLRKYQKFGDLMDILALKEKVERTNMVLNLDETIISEDDTPDSIGYTIGKFIYGRIMSDTTITSSKQHASKSDTAIKVKCQSQLWKKPLELYIEKTDKMRVLVIKCAEELKCDPEKIKLEFDGEVLNLRSTPDDLDLDGGEVFDLKITK